MGIESTPNHDGRLNDLYWSSQNTIDEILEEVGIGRNTLYASIDPFPAGLACPTCESVLVYRNRMNRAAGTLYCLTCEMETAVPEESETGASVSAGEAMGRSDRWRSELSQVAPRRAALIGGAAAAGVVAGAAAARTLR